MRSVLVADQCFERIGDHLIACVFGVNVSENRANPGVIADIGTLPIATKCGIGIHERDVELRSLGGDLVVELLDVAQVIWAFVDVGVIIVHHDEVAGAVPATVERAGQLRQDGVDHIAVHFREVGGPGGGNDAGRAIDVGQHVIGTHIERHGADLAGMGLDEAHCGGELGLEIPNVIGVPIGATTIDHRRAGFAVAGVIFISSRADVILEVLRVAIGPV